MAIVAAVFFMKKIDALQQKAQFLEVSTYAEIPVVGSYLQHKNQTLLGYEVEQVIYLQPNSEKWDIAVIAGGGSEKISSQEFYDAVREVRNVRWAAQGQEYRDRKNFKEPNNVWQRRKNIFERIQAGEKVGDIAVELGIQTARVKRLASEWRQLLSRIRRYGPEKEDESDG